MRKVEFWDPEILPVADLLDEAKPHWVGAAVGLVTAAASAAMSASQNAQNRRNQRNSAAMAGQGGAGGGANFQPTALAQMAKPQDTSGMGLADLLNKQQPQAQFNEIPKNEAFSADAKPRPAGSQDSDFHVTPTVQDEQSKEFGTKDYINSASQLAGVASQLAQRAPGGPGAPVAQPGQMNFQPTALAMLARRSPYGGF